MVGLSQRLPPTKESIELIFAGLTDVTGLDTKGVGIMVNAIKLIVGFNRMIHNRIQIRSDPIVVGLFYCIKVQFLKHNKNRKVA